MDTVVLDGFLKATRTLHASEPAPSRIRISGETGNDISDITRHRCKVSMLRKGSGNGTQQFAALIIAVIWILLHSAQELTPPHRQYRRCDGCLARHRLAVLSSQA